MITVEFLGIVAQVENGKWMCERKSIEDYFNSLTDPLGPSGADPYPDLTIARIVMDRLGGTVVKIDVPPPVRQDVVY